LADLCLAEVEVFLEKTSDFTPFHDYSGKSRLF
jgi:hypothetical protein